MILASSLSSNAQYQQAVRGDLVGFDSAVVVRIDKYRQIRLLVQDAPQLVDSLQSALQESQTIVDNFEFVDQSYRNEIFFLEETILLRDEKLEQKDKLIHELRNQPAPVPPKDSFLAKIKKGIPWLSTGVLIGVLASQK